jgi:hypothetical protein
MPADAHAAANVRVDVICNRKTWRWHEILQHLKKESWLKQNPQIFHRCLEENTKWKFVFEKNKENAPRDGSGKLNWV